MFGSDWSLRRWDPFDMNWNVWRQFETMDRMLERSFDRFEDEMFNTRRNMLQAPEVTQRQIQPSSSTYTKSYHSVDQREDVIDGKRIKYKTLETTKEKDGVKIPHIVREIECDPPCDVETLQKHIQFRENVGGREQQLFLTFLDDAKKNQLEPQKIVKYQNEIKHNPDTNKQDAIINVSFVDKNNQRHVYQWQKAQDAIEAETKIDDPLMLQNYAHGQGGQQEQTQQQQQWQTQSHQQQQNVGQQQKLGTSQTQQQQQHHGAHIGTHQNQQYMGSDKHTQQPGLSKDIKSQGQQQQNQNINQTLNQQNLPQQMQL